MDIETFNSIIDECWHAYLCQDHQAFAAAIEKLRDALESRPGSGVLLDQARNAFPHLSAMQYITQISNNILDAAMARRPQSYRLTN